LGKKNAKIKKNKIKKVALGGGGGRKKKKT